MNTRKHKQITRRLQNWVDEFSEYKDGREFDSMVEEFGFDDVLEVMWDNYRNFPELICDRIIPSNTLTTTPKTIKTIGMIYEDYKNGGVQRVLSSLIPSFQKFGYKIILITETPPTKDDYSLPSGVKRAMIESKSNIVSRVSNLKNIIAENHIDLIIHHFAYSDFLPFDLILFRSLNVRTIVEYHSAFTAYIHMGVFHKFISKMSCFRLADHVVCLSNFDLQWYQMLGLPATQINNPVEQSTYTSKPDSHSSNTLLWVGRFDKLKRPVDVIKIFQIVKQSIKDARLVIVGKTSESDEFLKMSELIDKYRLSNSVSFAGYHIDLSDFYSDAGILVSTSETESWGMTFVEAMAAGIPVVMYDLPNLQFFLDPNIPPPGIVRSPQPHPEWSQAAIEKISQNIITILKQTDLQTRLASQQLKCFAHLSRIDVPQKWVKLFKELERVDSTKVNPKNLMIQYFFEELKMGLFQLTKNITEHAESKTFNNYLKTVEWESLTLTSDLFWTNDQVINLNNQLKTLEHKLTKSQLQLKNANAEIIAQKATKEKIQNELDQLKNSKAVRLRNKLIQIKAKIRGAEK